MGKKHPFQLVTWVSAVLLSLWGWGVETGSYEGTGPLKVLGPGSRFRYTLKSSSRDLPVVRWVPGVDVHQDNHISVTP